MLAGSGNTFWCVIVCATIVKIAETTKYSYYCHLI